ncbi:MAG: protein kinase [Gammaproteobacteria bacterium]|nr:protein kinase [Gammaproteobacteria bacterium]
MKILLIDDCEITLESMRVFLEQEIPGVEVTEYPSLLMGKPGPEFNWAAYDVLLLDYDLGNGQTGVDWLREIVTRPGFPRTVLITGVGDSYVVADAIKLGAEGYLNKSDLTPERLAKVVYEVLAHPRGGSGQPSGPQVSPLEAEAMTYGFERERSSKDDGPRFSYRFGGVIGRGEDATVYIAERIPDKLTVAIKILDRTQAHEPENLQRFIREGQLVSQIKSPHVVKIYEQGFTQTYGYIAMEFFGRGNLKQQIEKGLSEQDVLRCLHTIANALEAIHALDIVHRDLKPANVMFRSDGSMALADFGISKRIGSGLDLTRAGTVIGTPHYISPEQAEGRPADKRSDLYSLGCMLYEMLTGTKPYKGDTVSALIFQHMHAPIPKLAEGIAHFQPMINRLMAKKPEDRYQNVGELLSALGKLNAAA